MKRKLVVESLEELKRNKKSSINEGVFSNIVSLIKRSFKKIGKFFYSFIEGEPIMEANTPTNIGVLDKMGMLPSAVSYVPDMTDIALDPALRTLSPDRIITKRGRSNIRESKVNEAKVALQHPNKNIPNVDRDELYDLIEIAIMKPKSTPLLIWGAPGIGKTQIVQAVVNVMYKDAQPGQRTGEIGGKISFKKRLIDVQTSKMAPDDWNLPAIMTKPSGEQIAHDIPKTWLPVYIPTGDPEEDAKRDEIANNGEGGVLFLDELSRAIPLVQATCLKLIDERIIGNAVLGSKWVIVAAANRSIDDPNATINWSTALGNRFKQFNYVPEFDKWKEWAIGKVDQRIIDFLHFNQEYFYTLDDEMSEEGIFASPRSWVAASEAVKDLEELAKKKGVRPTTQQIIKHISGSVGSDVAIQLSTFLRILESFTKEDIKKILENADKAKMPKKVGSGYELSEANAIVSLAVSQTMNRKVSPEEFTNFCKYLVRLDNPSLAQKGIRMMADAHPEIHMGIGTIGGKQHSKDNTYQEGAEIYATAYKDFF